MRAPQEHANHHRRSEEVDGHMDDGGRDGADLGADHRRRSQRLHSCMTVKANVPANGPPGQCQRASATDVAQGCQGSSQGSRVTHSPASSKCEEKKYIVLSVSSNGKRKGRLRQVRRWIPQWRTRPDVSSCDEAVDDAFALQYLLRTDYSIGTVLSGN